MNSNYLEYKGSGDEVRSYLHVEDAADLFVDLLEDKFCNKYVIINGKEKYTGKEFVNLLTDLFDGSINESLIKYQGDKRPGHYNATPFNYIPRRSQHIYKNSYIDLGQGILDLAYHLKKDN